MCQVFLGYSEPVENAKAVGSLFFVIGVVDLKSKKPVGFFTGVKPPKITDVKNYNKAVAMLWFVTGIVFELIGVPFLYLKQNSPAFVFVMLATVVLVIVMMVGIKVRV